MKKRVIMGIIVAGCLVLCACSTKDTTKENISGNGSMSVSEEIAAEVSENIIPEEAMEYIALSCSIPEGFSPTSESNDTQAIYVSDSLEDYSYITYTRQEVDATSDYTLLTQEDYQTALENRLATTVNMTSYASVQEEDYYLVSLGLTYEKDGKSYLAQEEIYVTDKYLFTMVFAEGSGGEWATQFAESMASLKLESIASMGD